MRLGNERGGGCQGGISPLTSYHRRDWQRLYVPVADTISVMVESLGRLCIVLHGHLPYVLHHGAYPHGEAWLYEAAAETYLPILDMIGECALLKARPAI